MRERGSCATIGSMRPALALVLSGAFTVCAVGCTLLVNFDDTDAGAAAPGDDDDGTSSGTRKPGTSSSSTGGTTSSSGDPGTSSSSGDPGTSSSTSSSSGAAVFPPPCDTANLAAIDCAGKGSGFYCGLDPAAPEDLAQCEDDAPKCRFKCTMGCAKNPTGIPDQCGNCTKNTNAENWYCAKDVGWLAETRGLAFACVDGKVVNGLVRANNSPAQCGVQGASSLCHTICTRSNPLPGSCCQSTAEP